MNKDNGIKVTTEKLIEIIGKLYIENEFIKQTNLALLQKIDQDKEK